MILLLQNSFAKLANLSHKNPFFKKWIFRVFYYKIKEFDFKPKKGLIV